MSYQRRLSKKEDGALIPEMLHGLLHVDVGRKFSKSTPKEIGPNRVLVDVGKSGGLLAKNAEVSTAEECCHDTPHRKLLVARCRIYMNILKLVGPSAFERQAGKKGHVFAFAQHGALEGSYVEEVAAGVTMSAFLPEVRDLHQYLSVSFLGSRLQWEALLTYYGSKVEELQELQVRADVVYPWMQMLKKLNPWYRNVSVADTPDIGMKIKRVTQELLAHATCLDDPIVQRIDQLTVLKSTVTDDENESVADVVEDENRSYLPLQSSVVLKRHCALQDQGDNSPRIFQNLLLPSMMPHLKSGNQVQTKRFQD
ncbi:hypothetical protein OUZ56_012372 [Daphnia magna]|uniref:DUF6570 domain-containing protein n=1 Tax=Daphnia magna TaxID=35525 RepID=A0ABQ9Z2T3_9CRUS|nr:hypothetical protein OUZ56_012372 [Daphnia magna]